MPVGQIEDFGLTFMTTKNASGGGYEGLHRKFIVQCGDGMEVPFVLSVFATAKTTSHPVYGNRSGSTQLNIAMQHTPNSAYNLQVNLNKYVASNTKQYSIWHNGTRSRLKTAYVLETVREHADFLLDGEQVKLGTFPINETMSIEQFSTFVENIISYSYCRHLADLKYRK